MGTYFQTPLLTNLNFREEYVFQYYTDVSSVKESFRSKAAKIKGKAEYSGTTGLTLSGGASIELINPQTPLDPFVKTLCYFFAFKYVEPIGENFILYQRGDPGKPYSMAIKINKEKKVVLDVGYVTTKGSPSNKQYINNKAITPDEYHEINACLSQGPDFISGGAIFLDGNVEFFDVKKSIAFDWDLNASKNSIFLDGWKDKGSVDILMFSVEEGAGGVIFSAEDHKEVAADCLNKCELPTSSISDNFKCHVCVRKSNNVNNLETKNCEEFCKIYI